MLSGAGNTYFAADVKAKGLNLHLFQCFVRRTGHSTRTHMRFGYKSLTLRSHYGTLDNFYNRRNKFNAEINSC